MPTTSQNPFIYLPACRSSSADLPWVPSAIPGNSSKLLRVLADDRGFVELLHMEPGVLMPLHRHTGEIHAYNLSGTRRLCTGEIVGPGDYVFEPPGNVDQWQVIGDEPMIALVVVMGAVEFLAADGSVRSRSSARTQQAAYESHCRERGLSIYDLASG